MRNIANRRRRQHAQRLRLHDENLATAKLLGRDVLAAERPILGLILAKLEQLLEMKACHGFLQRTEFGNG